MRERNIVVQKQQKMFFFITVQSDLRKFSWMRTSILACRLTPYKLDLLSSCR